jgi:catechol 2,3-dioxygenase-like lactoylglutathione lyase family enzyme
MLHDSKLQPMLATTRPEDAKRFFGDLLGLRLVEEDPFALTFDGADFQLRLNKAPAFTPQPFTVLGWRVPDVRVAARDLAAKGVTFERFEGLDQDEVGVWTPPGGAGGVCWFKDPDGNLLSLSH